MPRKNILPIIYARFFSIRVIYANDSDGSAAGPALAVPAVRGDLGPERSGRRWRLAALGDVGRARHSSATFSYAQHSSATFSTGQRNCAEPTTPNAAGRMQLNNSTA